YMSQIEGEFRLRLADRWTASVFAGVACTYGSVRTCSDTCTLLPAAGAGVQYVLKPAVGIVLNLEYAHGKDGNYGVYLKTGDASWRQRPLLTLAPPDRSRRTGYLRVEPSVQNSLGAKDRNKAICS